LQHKSDAHVSGVVPDPAYKYAIVAAPTHLGAQELLAFWNARPSDGIVIGRDVPSRQIANILSHIAIYEPVSGRHDLKVRLAGNSVCSRYGCDIKGKLMSELFDPNDFHHHLRKTLEVLDNDAPLILDSHLISGSVERLHAEVVVMPVWPADRSGKWVLAGFFYFS
jgi:hypothetical protein